MGKSETIKETKQVRGCSSKSKREMIDEIWYMEDRGFEPLTF
jgi:hypothetical protein